MVEHYEEKGWQLITYGSDLISKCYDHSTNGNISLEHKKTKIISQMLQYFLCLLLFQMLQFSDNKLEGNSFYKTVLLH